MPEEQYTRCPACKTVFRVTSQQLAVRSGQVRCGHCRTVFDGQAALLPAPAPVAAESPATVESQTDSPRVAQAPVYDEAMMGPATMTLRTPQGETVAGDAPIGRIQPLDYQERFSAEHVAHRRRRSNLAYGLGVPLLLLLLAGQALYHFRDLIAARWPLAEPALVQLCALAGCELAPMRDVSGLSIEASDLQADPAHRGLLVLTATLRNRATWALGYPYLELTLTDARDQAVARRALAPTDYAGGTAAVDQGIPANGEVPVKAYIDASATSQAGYRLYVFYP
ncbi:MAG: DUF3426 domain-containing protein [Casimicrobiaceae bacterium]